MIQKNPTGAATLITPAEVIAKASKSHVQDQTVLSNAIEIAEFRFVRPLLGEALYRKLLDQKNKVVDSTNQAALQSELEAQEPGEPFDTIDVGDVVNSAKWLTLSQGSLWRGGLWRYVAEAVLVVALPDNYLQFTNQGLVKNNPVAGMFADSTEKTTGAGLKDVQFVVDNAINYRLQPLRDKVLDHLYRYANDFPDFIHPSHASGNPSGPGAAASSWATGIYDDEDERRGRCCRP